MTKCYTFYSYKGGSGRSTTALNTVKHLIEVLHADGEHPILIVDADLESAGLTYFFDCTEKFTDRFAPAVHTTKLLMKKTSSLSGLGGDHLFGYDADAEAMIAKTAGLVADLGKLYPANEVEGALRGISLLSGERDMLKDIVRARLERDNSPESRKLADSYRIDGLFPALYRIEQDAKRSPEERAAEKTRILRAFLPAVGFVDVSSYFAAAPGTVRFLGVDLRYRGEQILKGEVVAAAFNELKKECNRHGYRAIVCDSGAGVQSSADLLHTVSDLLVYCMRPTKQFRQGTRMQLTNYHSALLERMKEREADEDERVVVLLPTAVPMTGGKDPYSEAAFDEISAIATKWYKDVVDGTFCTKETALPEVSRFKWEESILDAEGIRGKADEEQAFSVYRRLAEVMAANTKDK